MPTKFGRVVRWGRRGSKFTEAYLDSGERVELSPAALEALSAHDPDTALVFVERRGRMFHYVQWLGTPVEALRGVAQGILRGDEITPTIRNIAAQDLAFEPMVSVHAPPAPVAPASQEGADAERLMFGPNGGQVAWFFALLWQRETETWDALVRALVAGLDSDPEVRLRQGQRVSSMLERAAARGVAAGGLTSQDVLDAGRLAEDAAQEVVPVLVDELMKRSTEPRERIEQLCLGLAGTVARTIAIALVVRPYLEKGEFEELWAPYAETLPLTF